MPGQYVVPTRAAGTLITELIYNNDHQNHVDGRSALEMGAYGISASQFQLTEDPFPGGVESIPFSLSGEITRLRFVLAQINSQLSGGQGTNWYDPFTAPGFATIGARVSRATLISVPNNFSTVISFSGATADFNTNGIYDDAGQPTRFTAPFPGKYMAFCYVTWAAAAGGRRQVIMGVNNVFSLQQRISNQVLTSSTQAQAITGLFDLMAADYIQFAAFQNSGGALNLTSVAGGLIFLGT